MLELSLQKNGEFRLPIPTSSLVFKILDYLDGLWHNEGKSMD
jgi:hypothetical protein